jgi:hypothetical protein
VVAQGQQGTPPPPPAVIRIFEENVKVGKNAVHEKLETNWVKAFAAAKWPGQTLAMKTIAGPPQAWFIEPHESMASVEKLAKDTEKMTALTAQTDLLSAQDGDLLTGVRTIIATYRADLSYLPSNAMPVPKLRYFDVEIFQVRPGHDAEFIESRKLTKAAHEQASMPDSMVYYTVAAGAPNGTFIRFRGVQSLADQDRYEQAHAGKAYQDAVSASTKRINELTSSSVVNIQHVIYEFDPKMSYMPKEFTSIDPDFWTPKPKPALTSPAAADTKKPKQ